MARRTGQRFPRRQFPRYESYKRMVLLVPFAVLLSRLCVPVSSCCDTPVLEARLRAAHAGELCFSGLRSSALGIQPIRRIVGAACPRHSALDTARRSLPRVARFTGSGPPITMQLQPNEKTVDASVTVRKGSNDASGADALQSKGDLSLVPMGSWLMLAILLVSNIHQQWTRALVFYLVSFKVPASEESARLYMNIDLGFNEEQYGLLASFGFTLVFTVFSLLAGRAADSGNRAGITALAAAGWSVATVAQGLSSSFDNVLGARGLTGLTQAFTNPAAFGLISSTFPEARVSTANSIYSSAVYVGGALASLTILLDNQIGWRDSSILIGVGGVALAGISGLYLKDPETRPPLFGNTGQGRGVKGAAEESGRLLTSEEQLEGAEGVEEGVQGQHPPPAPERVAQQLASAVAAVKQVLAIPFVQVLFAATACRFAAGYGIGVWKAPFFRESFPAFQNEFSVANALVISGGGVLSSLIGGTLADKYAPADARVRLWIPAAGSLLAIPLWLGTCYSESFYASIGMLFGEYIVAECWFGPTLASLYKAVPKEVQGTAQGLFSVLTACGNVMPLVIGRFQQDHPLPDVLAGTISVAYFGSSLLFFAASTLMRDETPKPKP